MFKNNLKKIRRQKNITQEELETKSGISRATISKIEKGNAKDLKVSTMVAIADALGVSVQRIFL